MFNIPLTLTLALMLGAPVLAGSTSAAPPVPSTSPIPGAATASGGNFSLGPYREIGHVRATTKFCSAIIEHAVQAVDLGVDNDGKIDVVVRTIRNADFDANLVTKNQALQLLTNQYAVLAQQAIAAERAAKSLRVDAAAAPDTQEKKNVTAFADALDGALHRQRTIARDLGGMIAIFNVRPQLSQMDREEMVINEQLNDNNYFGSRYTTAEDRVPPLLSTVARNAAEDFTYRQTGIVHDERAAAQLIEPTFSGC